jgi:hypothetical protein
MQHAYLRRWLAGLGGYRCQERVVSYHACRRPGEFMGDPHDQRRGHFFCFTWSNCEHCSDAWAPCQQQREKHRQRADRRHRARPLSTALCHPHVILQAHQKATLRKNSEDTTDCDLPGLARQSCTDSRHSIVSSELYRAFDMVKCLSECRIVHTNSSVVVLVVWRLYGSALN